MAAFTEIPFQLLRFDYLYLWDGGANYLSATGYIDFMSSSPTSSASFTATGPHANESDFRPPEMHVNFVSDSSTTKSGFEIVITAGKYLIEHIVIKKPLSLSLRACNITTILYNNLNFQCLTTPTRHLLIAHISPTMIWIPVIYYPHRILITPIYIQTLLTAPGTFA